jgi:hypothetical protein
MVKADAMPRWPVPVALALVFGRALAAHAATPREWRFDVFLGHRAIGTQVVQVTDEGTRKRVTTEARFDVNILFVNAYSYRHRNEEIWEGGCLASIESTTDDNGKPFRVKGTSGTDGFAVETRTARSTLPSCVRSFAYWNPDYLKAQRLLNAQTGEYEDVILRPLGDETLDVRGEPRPARRYALEGPKLRIDLWYSPDDDWLALESSSKGGRTIRYVRQ